MDFVEKTIAKRLFDDLVKAGHKISVDYNDGDEVVISQSQDWEAVREASDAVDDCWWLLGAPDSIGLYDGFVRLIWGNGRDCISDYSTSLDIIIEPISDWIETEKM